MTGRRPRRRARGEGTIYFHRGSGRWAGELLADGRKRTVYGATPEEVAAKLAELKRQAADGTLPEPNRVTVAEYADLWLRDAQSLRGRRKDGLAPNTVEVYANALRYVKDAYGNLRLRDLTGRHLTELYVRMRQSGLSLRQCEIVHKVAGQMLRAAVAERLIPRDVSQDVANPPHPVYDEPRALTPEEFQALLRATQCHALRHRWYVVFRLALDAALSRGEALGLQWRHVDLERGTVRVEQQALRHGRYTVVAPLKTKNRKRTNPLAPETVELLREWRAGLARRAGATEIPHDAFLFPMEHRGRVYLTRPTSPEALDAAFRTCAQEAGIQDVVFHNLRATAATWMAEAGVPPKTAAERLGDRVETVLRYYTRVTDRTQQEAARALASRLAQAASPVHEVHGQRALS